MSDRAADGTSESETRVESESRELSWHHGLSLLLDGIHLDGAGGARWSSGSTRHCDGIER